MLFDPLYAFYDNTLSHLSSDRKLDEISRGITVDKKFLRKLQMLLQGHKIEEITVSLGHTRKDKDGYKNKCTYLHVDRYKLKGREEGRKGRRSRSKKVDDEVE